ncbi:hypothetical protein IWW38_005681, partial [Coemansia aciculifera]
MHSIDDKGPPKIAAALLDASTPNASTPTETTLAVTEVADMEKQELPVAAVPLTRMRRLIVTISLALSILLVGLDTSIVTTAIPKIAHEFNALSSAAWIATAYMVTITALQPLYGRLSDIFGRVPSLISAIVLFMAGSAA